MFKTLFLSFVLLLCGCTTSGPKIPRAEAYDMMAPGIHKKAEPYVQSFIDVSDGIVEWSDFENVFIGFKDFPVDQTTVGTCWNVPFIKGNFDIEWRREIWLDKTFWKYSSHLEKEELVFHELGHCMLFRPHTELSNKEGITGFIEWLLFKIGIAEKKGYLEDGCPASYMHPSILPESCIALHREYYLDELFDYVEAEETIEETVVEERFYYRTL